MTASPSSFDQLVEHHRSEILAYLIRLLGNTYDAEDVCQDTLLRAYRAFERLSLNSNARAWLYRIATNSALNAIKRRNRAAARHQRIDPEEVAFEGNGDLENKERLRRISRAVDALPPKQRAALIQRRFQGMSYDEIANSLNCSAESARANVYQAIRKLREALRDA